MPLPGGITTIVLTGTYQTTTGDPVLVREGRPAEVTFTPSSVITDGTGKVIFTTRSVVAQLSASGQFSITLPCTDNAGLNPSGWCWNVNEVIPDLGRTYSILLPSTLGSTVDISDLSPVAEVTPVSSYVLSSQVGEPSGVAELDSGGHVPAGEIPDLSGEYLSLAGGTMTGFPVLPGNPTASLQAATKAYVDASSGDLTAGTGLTLSGATISLDTPVSVADGGTGGGSAPASTAYAAKASAAESVIYVSKASYASDSNDGLSIGSAKATIAEALTALGSSAGTIQVGAGSFTAAGTITLTQPGTCLRGMGIGLTTITVAANVTYGVVSQASFCEFSDFTVNVASGYTVTYGAGVTTAGSAESNRFTNILCQSGSGTMTNGFAVSPDAHQDVAFTTFYGCLASTVASAGWIINDGTAANVLGTHMFGCVSNGNTYGVRAQGAGFRWYGGEFGENSYADIYLASMNLSDPVVVEGPRSENSGRLLYATNVGLPATVAIRDYQFAVNPDSVLSADGAFINYGFSGTLDLVNITFRDQGSVTPLILFGDNIAASGETLTVAARGLQTSQPLYQLFSAAPTQSVTVLAECYTQLSSAAGNGTTSGTYIAGPVVLAPTSTTHTWNGTARDVMLPASFSPLFFGAAGNGTTDDTGALQACAAAAARVAGVIDLGVYTYLTSSPISVTGNFHMKGAGYNGGTITNSTSDLFTVSGSVSWVTFEGCTFTSASGGGHIWNAGTASMSFWKILGCVLTQDNPGKSIWYQTGGSWIDCLVDQQCFMSCAAFATVSPWSITGVAGNVNSVKFSRARILANGAPVPFFLIDPGSAAGWNEEVVFDHLTFELTTGGAIAMTACVDVSITMCSLWDIPGARTDTGCGTSSSTTVTDAAAVTGDLGKALNGPGIPAGTVITAVSAGTGYTISQAATATASGLTFTLGGPAANQYRFTQSTGGYPCRDIQVRGGRANANTASAGTGYSDFYADTHATNVLIDSFGGWGLPPVITSPSTQTTIINPVVSGFTVPVIGTVPGLSVSGLTGATAPTRWVGATAGGAPVSGTFATGDFVTDTANGTFWVCTSGGTSGTWATPVPGVPWEVQPSDVGVVAWTASPAKDPVVIKPSGAYAGILLMWLFRVPAAGTISKINYSLDVAGGTMANAYLGIYSAGSSATLLASCTTDQSTNMTGATGAYAATLSTPLAVTAGLYRAGLVIGSATTMPTFMAAGGANSASFTNMGISSAANFMSVSTGTGSTSLPAGPISSASFTAANIGLPVFVFS